MFHQRVTPIRLLLLITRTPDFMSTLPLLRQRIAQPYQPTADHVKRSLDRTSKCPSLQQGQSSNPALSIAVALHKLRILRSYGSPNRVPKPKTPISTTRAQRMASPANCIRFTLITYMCSDSTTDADSRQGQNSRNWVARNNSTMRSGFRGRTPSTEKTVAFQYNE